MGIDNRQCESGLRRKRKPKESDQDGSNPKRDEGEPDKLKTGEQATDEHDEKKPDGVKDETCEAKEDESEESKQLGKTAPDYTDIEKKEAGTSNRETDYYSNKLNLFQTAENKNGEDNPQISREEAAGEEELTLKEAVLLKREQVGEEKVAKSNEVRPAGIDREMSHPGITKTHSSWYEECMAELFWGTEQTVNQKKRETVKLNDQNKITSDQISKGEVKPLTISETGRVKPGITKPINIGLGASQPAKTKEYASWYEECMAELFEEESVKPIDQYIIKSDQISEDEIKPLTICDTEAVETYMAKPLEIELGIGQPAKTEQCASWYEECMAELFEPTEELSIPARITEGSNKLSDEDGSRSSRISDEGIKQQINEEETSKPDTAELTETELEVNLSPKSEQDKECSIELKKNEATVSAVGEPSDQAENMTEVSLGKTGVCGTEMSILEAIVPEKNETDIIQPKSSKKEKIRGKKLREGGSEIKIADSTCGQQIKTKHEAAVHKLATIQDSAAKVTFMYDYNMEMRNLPEVMRDDKNDEMCMKQIGDAQRLSNEQKYLESLYCYTDARALAESLHLVALSHAGRSNALYHLGLFKECVDECDRALFASCPDEMRPTLEARRQRAALRIPVKPRTYHEDVPKIEQKDQNLHIACASKLIQIRSNKQFGRHFVAKEDIDIGRLLMVEEPFGSIVQLERDQYYHHCHHCMELCYSLIPCDNCTQMLYCGGACKKIAFESYHKYECPIKKTIDRIRNPWMRPFCLKIIFKARREIFFGEIPHAEDTNYRSDRLKEIYQLQNNFKTFEPARHFLICSAVSILYHFVKSSTDFLGEHDDDKFKEVLLNLYGIMLTNSTPICELKYGGENFYDFVPFAAGMFSAFSLFNHSCAPNVTAVNHGKTMVAYSLYTIKKGEQCFISYDPVYYFKAKPQRQCYLSSFYRFRCTCIACENDWPTITELGERERTRIKTDFRNASEHLTQTLNVHQLRKDLPYFIGLLKKAEKGQQPSASCVRLSEVVMGCYRVFANKKYNLLMKH